jgi:hypothetical protein
VTVNIQVVLCALSRASWFLTRTSVYRTRSTLARTSISCYHSANNPPCLSPLHTLPSTS